MFDKAQVTKVYSGRKGCACGCRGKYSYAAAHRDDRPDYYAGDEGINDQVVKTIINRVESYLRDRPEQVDRVHVDDDWIAVDLVNDRTYTIYFAERTKK